MLIAFIPAVFGLATVLAGGVAAALVYLKHQEKQRRDFQNKIASLVAEIVQRVGRTADGWSYDREQMGHADWLRVLKLLRAGLGYKEGNNTHPDGYQFSATVWIANDEVAALADPLLARYGIRVWISVVEPFVSPVPGLEDFEREIASARLYFDLRGKYHLGVYCLGFWAANGKETKCYPLDTML